MRRFATGWRAALNARAGWRSWPPRCARSLREASRYCPSWSRAPRRGERLAAVTVLQVIPDPEYLPWLVDRIAAEKPFIGYHAAVALLAAARELPNDDLPLVEDALVRAEAAAGRLRRDAD